MATGAPGRSDEPAAPPAGAELLVDPLADALIDRLDRHDRPDRPDRTVTTTNASRKPLD